MLSGDVRNEEHTGMEKRTTFGRMNDMCNELNKQLDSKETEKMRITTYITELERDRVVLLRNNDTYEAEERALTSDMLTVN